MNSLLPCQKKANEWMVIVVSFCIKNCQYLFFGTRGKDSKGITQYVDRRALTSGVKFLILTIPGITTPTEIPKYQ